MTDYAEGELFQILEDDHQLPEDQVIDLLLNIITKLVFFLDILL